MTKHMTDILVIEDNEELGTLVSDFLRREGYSVEWKTSAEDGLLYLKEAACKLLLLDVMLPGMDGYEAVMKIRSEQSLPVLMISARTDDESKILGLEAGADDYIDKPFSIPVLSHKIKALMRRSYELTEDRQILSYKNISMDLQTRTVYKDDRKINIKGKEFELLEYLMSRPGQVLKKEDLFDAVWGYDALSEFTTLNVHIRWLREKLEDDPRDPKFIQTVWRVGYRFGGSEEE